MAKLIYSMVQSLDGYIEDAEGKFGWGAPDDDEVHSYISELASSLGTHLYGRRTYDTMVGWETAHLMPGQPPAALEWARQWQRADKVVYSKTLAEPRSARTRIEREFDPEAIRRLKASASRDLSVAGPTLAARAICAGLVDEFQLIVCPVVVERGKRFFPNGVQLVLDLLEERRFRNGVVVLRFAVKIWSISANGRAH